MLNGYCCCALLIVGVLPRLVSTVTQCSTGLYVLLKVSSITDTSSVLITR